MYSHAEAEDARFIRNSNSLKKVYKRATKTAMASDATPFLTDRVKSSLLQLVSTLFIVGTSVGVNTLVGSNLYEPISSSSSPPPLHVATVNATMESELLAAQFSVYNQSLWDSYQSYRADLAASYRVEVDNGVNELLSTRIAQSGSLSSLYHSYSESLKATNTLLIITGNGTLSGIAQSLRDGLGDMYNQSVSNLIATNGALSQATQGKLTSIVADQNATLSRATRDVISRLDEFFVSRNSSLAEAASALSVRLADSYLAQDRSLAATGVLLSAQLEEFFVSRNSSLAEAASTISTRLSDAYLSYDESLADRAAVLSDQLQDTYLSHNRSLTATGAAVFAQVSAYTGIHDAALAVTASTLSDQLHNFYLIRNTTLASVADTLVTQLRGWYLAYNASLSAIAAKTTSTTVTTVSSSSSSSDVNAFGDSPVMMWNITWSNLIAMGDVSMVVSGTQGIVATAGDMTNVWSNRLAAKLGTTVFNNIGNSVSWSTAASHMYSDGASTFGLNSQKRVTTLFMVGQQDAKTETTIGLGSSIDSMETAMLFASIPYNNKFGFCLTCARGAVLEGEWGSPSTGQTLWGAKTGYTTSVASVTTAGRYVAVSFQIDKGSTFAYCANVAIDINSNAFGAGISLVNPAVSISPTTAGSKTFIYDTGTTGTKVVRVRINGFYGGWTAGITLVWIAGWNENPTGANPVLVGAIPRMNDASYAGNQLNRDLLNNAASTAARKFRRMYGLPIYYVERTADSYMSSMDSLGSVYAGKSAHQLVARAFFGAIVSNGLEPSIYPSF